MKRLDIMLETGKSAMAEVRPLLEAAISEHFDDGFLRHRWDGDVLRLSGPGAEGSIVHESGRLRLRADLRPPASWVHTTIQRKIQAALDDLAGRIG